MNSAQHPAAFVTDAPDAPVRSPFEMLRLRVEADVAARFDPDKPLSRRPSWAPPLVLSGELLDLCIDLKLLTPEDKPVARLWAQFANPRRRGRVLREVNRDKDNAMVGIACRGFELDSGTERAKTHEVLFHAQRSGDGKWQTGPVWSEPWRPRFDSAAAAQRAVASAQTMIDGFKNHPAYTFETHARALRDYEQNLQDKQRALAEAQAIAEQRYQTAVERYKLRRRATELAAARVAEFAGDADAQMRVAGRLSGMCCICSRVLTDPKSLEVGIGPECIEKVRCITPGGKLVRMLDAIADGRLEAVDGELRWVASMFDAGGASR